MERVDILEKMRKFIICMLTGLMCVSAQAIDLGRCDIVVSKGDAALARKMARTLAEDIERVTDVRPEVSELYGEKARLNEDKCRNDTPRVVLATVDQIGILCSEAAAEFADLRGCWERYRIVTRGNRLMIVGSDARGLAYGVFHVSERIGVSPWYWFADVPVVKRKSLDYAENFTSVTPSVKYRGIFINDEDWGLKPWASNNYEKELGDIGPKTYNRVCELILRLKGNMLAPAMHSCTGAFFSHPESQVVADSWGIMITTSHCEPLLVNNAAETEWNKAVDGEWNYVTNRENILKKFDRRLAETAQYDNIYTMGLRGLHDEAMTGPTNPGERARVLERVFADQREILEQYKGRKACDIAQIFVPYKETLDIYDAGLRVPEDITLVWPDDNYGYMKRVSNEAERRRKGGAGVYYHLSYLGTPHDNLWISTTAPVLMYEELRKAYEAGADRYWLLNVGDIKPMEIEMQQFFDMAWDFSDFTYENANRCQAKWLASVFGKKYEAKFQRILDEYYRLAWQRKPEFMGYEIEWDSQENMRRHDTDFSFETGTAQRRLADYKAVSDLVDGIEKQLPKDFRPAFFEMLGYSVKSAYQINRKYLMAQRNHETGDAQAAREAVAAHDSIQTLVDEYNGLLGGKWNQMMSQVPPGFCAKYQEMPELVESPTDAYKLPDSQRHPEFARKLALNKAKAQGVFRLVEGIGCDWLALQLGNPLDEAQDPSSLESSHISLPLGKVGNKADSVTVCVSVVPFWPISSDRSNRFGVSADGCRPVVCENKFEEWSPEWKLQVLENRKEFVVTLPLDSKRSHHTLTFVVGDPGQMIQKVTYKWE